MTAELQAWRVTSPDWKECGGSGKKGSAAAFITWKVEWNAVRWCRKVQPLEQRNNNNKLAAISREELLISEKQVAQKRRGNHSALLNSVNDI